MLSVLVPLEIISEQIKSNHPAPLPHQKCKQMMKLFFKFPLAVLVQSMLAGSEVKNRKNKKVSQVSTLNVRSFLPVAQIFYNIFLLVMLLNSQCKVGCFLRMNDVSWNVEFSWSGF